MNPQYAAKVNDLSLSMDQALAENPELAKNAATSAGWYVDQVSFAAGKASWRRSIWQGTHRCWQ